MFKWCTIKSKQSTPKNNFNYIWYWHMWSGAWSSYNELKICKNLYSIYFKCDTTVYFSTEYWITIFFKSNNTNQFKNWTFFEIVTLNKTPKSTHIFARFSEHVSDSPAVPEPLVETGDDAHDEWVAGAHFVLHLSLLIGRRPWGHIKHQTTAPEICGR